MSTQSGALREAGLRSEIRRSCAVMVVLILVLLLVVSREMTGDINDRLPRVGAIGIASLFVVQVVVLLMVRWCRQRDRDLPFWFSAATVAIESAVPTGIMLLQIVPGSLPPYAVLSAPPVLAYGLLIGLTPLRLRPALCIVAGIVCTGGYVATLLYVKYGLGIMEPTTGLPRAAYISTPTLIFISGLAAAWVAQEIRTHMLAALAEADTRLKMHRIEQDIEVARSIQRALLPRSAPTIPGYDIAGWNRPADQTGGDYYDWQQLPDGTWIVSLADVSGHGIGPALVTAACRAYMRASSRYEGDLARLTAQINGLLADDLPEGRFVTLVSVLIDPRGGPLGILSAGHGPLLLWIRAAEEVRDLTPSDIPLAVIPDMTFGPPQILSLAPGDILALITDGFFEWARSDEGGRREQFGLDRLRASLRRHADLPAAAMVEALAADAAAFGGDEPQQDDLTVVIIKRTV